jgi:hypothetical protein
MEGGELARKLGREIGIPLVLSINVDLKMNKQGEDDLFNILLKILKEIR